MNRSMCVRAIVAVAMVFCCVSAFAGISYVSNGSGSWSDSSKWTPSGIPGAGDSVTIANSDTITVNTPQTIDSVAFSTSTGNHTLVIDGATLTVEAAGNAFVIDPVSSLGTNEAIIQNGGILALSNGNLAIDGGASSLARLSFGTAGGTLDVAGNIVFSGSQPNAQIDFAGNAGTVYLSGDLGNGGNIFAAGGTFIFNGSSGQTINSYTFDHFKVNKSGTATLNGPITVNGDFRVESGLLDDGGYQISLNAGNSSNVFIDSTGVLKLGSAASATSFPNPLNPANVSMNPGAAVDYQAGVGQVVDAGFDYQRLYLTTTAGGVARTFGGSLHVLQDLVVGTNVNLNVNAESLDADANITGTGFINLTTGSVSIEGSFDSTITLSAGTGTVTYDGASAQNVHPTNYYNLTIDKSGGIATVTGNIVVAGDFRNGTVIIGFVRPRKVTTHTSALTAGTFDAGTYTVTFSGDFENHDNVAAGSATFIFNGTALQSVTSDPSLTIGTLTINNANNVSMPAATSINTALNLTQGKLTVSDFFVDVSATITRTSGWIVGPLTLGLNGSPARTFPIGTGTTYLPVTADAGNPGTLTIQAVEGPHPNATGTNTLQRYWSITAPSTATPLDSISFSYNAGDVSGTEANYVLSQYNGGAWSTYGDVVNEGTHIATATGVTTYFGDWTVGSAGSTGFASSLAVTSVNGGSDPAVNTPFSVVVEARDDNNNPANVSASTTISLTVLAGSGSLAGGTTSDNIGAGTSNITITNVQYDTVENGVVLRATASGGDALGFADSTIFNVTGPTIVTVTNLNDSGPGSLRDAVTNANSGACAAPCTIEFSVSGAIVLATALPPIVVDNLTIDGFTAPGSSPNTNAFGAPSNAVITVNIDGNGSVGTGFDIQGTFDKIRGLAIGNFTSYGVHMNGDNSGSNVSGCYIGTDTTGTTSNANDLVGIFLDASTESSVGGFTPDARNVISGNGTANAIEVGSGSNTITLAGNYVGVRADLAGALPNDSGIVVQNGASSVAIGSGATGNVVSGNTNLGISVDGSGVTIEGNYIGTAGNSATAIPNQSALTVGGNAVNTTVGGTTSPSQQNTISGNTNAVAIYGNSTLLDQNLIGIAPDGTTALGNTGSGIVFYGTASNTIVGGTYGNAIAHNQNGVAFDSAATGTANKIRKNRIFANTQLGIDLKTDGVTANDAGDADTGPNNLQNFPALATAYKSGSNLTVTFSLDSASSGNVGAVVVDLYKADTSATPQAQTWLGESNCLAGNVFTNANLTIAAASINLGDKVIATTTSYSDPACTTLSEGTSEFSAASTVAAAPIHWIGGTGAWESSANWDSGTVPGAGDVVLIDQAGTYTVTLSSMATIGSIQVGTGISGQQTLDVAGGASLVLSSASSVVTTGVLSFSGNALMATGGLDVDGKLDWDSNGTISGAGGINIDGSFNINNAGSRTLEALVTISASGAANWNAAFLYLQNGGGFDNYGTFEVLTDNTLYDNGSDGGFDNFNLFRKSVTSGATTFTGVDFNNSGTVAMQTGSLALNSGTSTGAITLASGTEILFNSIVYTLGAGTSSSGLGKLHISGGTVTVSGAASIDNIAIDSGTLNGPGAIALGGQLAWTGGMIGGSGTISVSSTAVVNVSGAGSKALDSRTISLGVSGATMNIAGTGGFNLQNGANIAIASGATLDLQGDATIFDNGADGGINNAGMFKKSAGTTTTLVNVDLTNSGTLKVGTGTLNPGNVTNNAGTIDLSTGDLLVDAGDTVTLNTSSSVTGTGTLRVNGGTLTVNGAVGIPNLDFLAGLVNGTGALSCTTCAWSGGMMSGSGTTTIPSAATLTVGGTAPKTLARALSISAGGTATWGGSNSISLQSGGAIANAGSMSITQPLFFLDGGTAGDITNSGTLTINTAGFVSLYVTLDSSGNLTLTTGSLNLYDGTNSGAISIGSSSTLVVDDPSYTFAAGTTLSGTGLLQVDIGGTLNVNTNVSSPNFILSGGTLTGTGTLSLTGTAGWSNGTMSGSGITRVTGTGTLTHTNGNKTLTSRTLDILSGGTLVIGGTETLTLITGAAITNAGLVSLTSNTTFTNGGAAGAITNTGTFRKSGGATGTTTISNINFANNGGTVDLQSGIVAMNGGTFSQSSGTLQFTLAGTTAGTGFGQLTTTSMPTLGGTLSILLQGPYQPLGGDTFRVLGITGGSHSGDFASTSYPALTGGRTITRAYDTSGLLLTVNGAADVSISKSAPASVPTGGAISYTLTVNNAGPDPATSVVVTDTLPAGHTGINASGTGWSCGVVTDTVTCNATGSLATGNANAITINANAPATPQTFINTANVSATNDTNNTNDSGTANVTVTATNADVAASATGPVAPLPPSSPAAFTFAITNNGPANATSVQLTAPIPAALTYASYSATQGSCNFAGNTVTCSLGTINAASNATVTINVTTTATSGTHTITGAVSATEPDGTPANNSSSASVSVTGNVITVTSANDTGDGSLRQALTDAQNGICTAPCTIQFALASAPATIALGSALPNVGTSTTIDATTQSGYSGTPLIILNGSGLVLAGNNAVVKGLAIFNAATAVTINGSGNTVQQCFLGLDGGGNAGSGNSGVIINGDSNTIDNNVVSGNATYGVVVQGTAAGNTIQGNRIGTDSAGTSARPNGTGVFVDGTATVTARNPRSESIVSGTTISGNTINNNSGDGVFIGSASNTVIDTNTIANNGGNGVVVTTGSANKILTNSIFSNAGLGIDLGDDGATANDAGDADTGGNGLQNSPNATGAFLIGGGDVTVTYNIDSSSAPVASVYIEFFKDDTAGEGKTWLAAACIAGNSFASGTSFNAPAVAAGNKIVLTATSYSDSSCGTVSDGTSEFSNTVTVTSCTPPPVTITGPTSSCSGSPVTLDAGAGFADYLWSNGAITQTITVSPTSTQTYSVTVKDGIGCSNTDTHTVTITSTPTVTITAPAAACQNTSGHSASVGVVAGATYNWTVTNGTLDSGQGTSAITFTAGASGSVGISVTVTSGSCSGSGSTSVPISTPPSVAISGPASVCPHAPFILDAGPGYSSYLWSNGATTQTISLQQSAATATYSVTVSSGGCSATDTHVVTLSANPQAAISAPHSAQPSTTYTATVQTQAGATYDWSVANGSLLSGDGTDTITFKTGATGQTKLSVSINVGGCTATDIHYVNISGGTDADLVITKTAVTTVTAGTSFTYTIGVANNGPAAASGISITDPLPAGTSLVSFNDGPFTCSPSNGTLACSGTLAAGASSAISIVVTAPQQPGTITNTATITAATSDPNPSNNSASATTNVIANSPSCATVPPTLIAPINNASATSPVNFQWSSVIGATLYEVWRAGDTPTLLGSTASTSFSAPLPSGPASWFVVAHLAGGCDPLVSATASFNVTEGSNCATNGAPQIAAPSSGASLSSPVTFSWMPVPQAIGYRVWIESNGTAAQDIGTTDGAIMLTANVPAGATVVYVDALFSGCPSTRSAAVAFTAQTPSPCEGRTAATLVAPANNAVLNSSAIDFSWLPAPNASGYRVWASVDGGTPAVLGTTVDDTTLHAAIGNGSVVWWVEALYDGCASVDSAPRNFTIPAAQQCGSAVPQLVAPSANATLTDASVQFSWTSVPNAIAYELWLALDHGTPVLAGTTSSTSLTRVVAPGLVEWFVRAIIDRCAPRDSQTSTFTYQPPAACAANQRPVAIEPLGGATIDAPAGFKWTAPAGARHYELYVIRGNQAPALVVSTNVAHTGGVNLAAGKLRWFVRAFFGDDCPPLDSVEVPLEIVEKPAACATLTAPVISVPGQISGGTPFTIYWTPSAGATAYQLQIATRADFGDAQTITTAATSSEHTRTNDGSTPIAMFARVRAIDGRCQPAPTVTAYGPTSAFFILPPSGIDGSAPVEGDGVMHFTIELGPELAGQTFSATPKAAWLTVDPSSGVVAPGGTTLNVTANASGLPLGTSLGAINVILNASSGRVTTNATSIAPTFSVSLVTPVTPLPKNTPPPDALIIPAVAHADGINSKFQSDVRVSNTSPQVIKYQLTFTPSGVTGIGSGSQTTFSIDPGRTIALDDILKSWFGTGTTSTTGTLEIRPLTQTTTTTPNSVPSGLTNLVTFASSRTFNATSNGTFGQYIPAVPFANFISFDALKKKIISLQQIAQSDRYRTNLGLVEGSGQAASLLVKVFGENGQKLTEFPVNLTGGQHTQLNGFLASNGITSLNDGRVEIEVTSPTGKVTAYASVLDNVTSDPLLVTPMQLTDAGDTKWVLPGAADLNNGFANWQTDMRVFNGGTTDVDATLTFYSQNGGEPRVANVTIPAGQVKQFDKTVSTLFGATNDGGAIHISTAAPTRLVATARTYNQTTGGTYGQFISAVTPVEAAGTDTRPLQILQVEESARFRSNIGLAEVTGNPVRIEIAVVPPDAKFTAVTQLDLKPNEFRQIGSLLKSVGLSDTFNARVTVRVLQGTGRITAYASVIDAITNDPTYIPAQ